MLLSTSRAGDRTTASARRRLTPSVSVVAIVSLISTLATAAVGGAVEPEVEGRGSIILLGGGSRPSYVMDRIVAAAGGRSARVLVVPAAHPRPREEAAAVSAELVSSGAGTVETLALDPGSPAGWEALQRVEQASGIFLTGGDQQRLLTVLEQTDLWEAIVRLLARGGVVAGESAGASVLGAKIVTGAASGEADPDRSIRAIRKGAAHVVPGLALLPHAIVDQHFLHRRRHNRLLTALLEHPQLLALGIDEATAVEIDGERRLEVLGEGLVTIYDLSWGSEVTTDRNGNLAATGVTLHLLRAGQAFDLADRSAVD